MRLIAFRQDSGLPRLGLRIDQDLVDLTALGFPATLDLLLQQGPGALQVAGKAAAGDAGKRAYAHRFSCKVFRAWFTPVAPARA